MNARPSSQPKAAFSISHSIPHLTLSLQQLFTLSLLHHDTTLSQVIPTGMKACCNLSCLLTPLPFQLPPYFSAPHSEPNLRKVICPGCLHVLLSHLLLNPLSWGFNFQCFTKAALARVTNDLCAGESEVTCGASFDVMHWQHMAQVPSPTLGFQSPYAPITARSLLVPSLAAPHLLDLVVRREDSRLCAWASALSNPLSDSSSFVALNITPTVSISSLNPSTSRAVQAPCEQDASGLHCHHQCSAVHGADLGKYFPLIKQAGQCHLICKGSRTGLVGSIFRGSWKVKD